MENFGRQSLNRIFKEVRVGCYSQQTPLERFPELTTGTIVEHEDLLRVANWRNNLTALSQHYNLYFTAIRDRIHATIPRNLKQILPGKPDLDIELPISAESMIIGGHADPHNPHFINHLMVGELGGREMVLVCCDDGDVVGYWTCAISEAITAVHNKTLSSDSDILKLSPRETADACKAINKEFEVKPMFHENVQKSAWGLAIHSQSCLIAVSTNLSEIHIFGFAKRRDPKDVDCEQSEKIEYAIQGVKTLFPRCTEADDFPNSALDHREHGYRLLFHLHTHENHPTVAFANDFSGEAALILAADTGGVMWKVNLWDREVKCTPRKPFVDSAGEMAWGLLVLDVKAFRIETSPYEATGMPKLSRVLAHVNNPDETQFSMKYLNNSAQIYDVQDRSTFGFERSGANILRNEDNEEDDDPATTIPELDDRGPMSTRLSSKEAFKLLRQTLLRPSTFSDNKVNPELPTEQHIFHELMNMTPSCLSEIRDWDAVRGVANTRSHYPNENHASTDDDEGTSDLSLPDGSALLRTYAYDIELIPPTKGILSTVLKRAVFHPLRSMPRRTMRINRLNLLLPIPSLSLVAAGSQSGDVALLTLTRLPNGYSKFGPFTTFRLDHILPFERQIPPNRWPLLGLAVSPVQGNKGKDRWRIMLHYTNHTVVSYEVWRGENGEVMII